MRLKSPLLNILNFNHFSIFFTNKRFRLFGGWIEDSPQQSCEESSIRKVARITCNFAR